MWQGCMVRESTKQGNDKVARQMEAAHRTSLAKGEVGIRERKVISLADFIKRDFLTFCESKFGKAKPKTLFYYQYGAKKLQESDFASLNLADITDQHSGHYAAKHSDLSPSTVNCGLRGERQRERIVTNEGIHGIHSQSSPAMARRCDLYLPRGNMSGRALQAVLGAPPVP
jgi:hypothetical protein